MQPSLFHIVFFKSIMCQTYSTIHKSHLPTLSWWHFCFYSVQRHRDSRNMKFLGSYWLNTMYSVTFLPTAKFQILPFSSFVLLSFCWQHYFMYCHLCKEIICECPICLLLDIQVKNCHFFWYKIERKSSFLIAPKFICHKIF